MKKLIKICRTITTSMTCKIYTGNSHHNNLKSPTNPTSPTIKGFTIAELMIVIGIIAILMGISMNMYRDQKSNFTFNDSLSKILDIIKTARNYSVTSKGYWDDTTNKSIIPKEGYGVYIEKNGNGGNFILFANTDTTDAAGINAGVNQFNGDDKVLETYELPDSAFFTEFKGKDADGNENDINYAAVIIFRPPLAEAFIAENPRALPIRVNNINQIIDLTIGIRRFNAPDDVSPKIISINSISGFPEIQL